MSAGQRHGFIQYRDLRIYTEGPEDSWRRLVPAELVPGDATTWIGSMGTPPAQGSGSLLRAGWRPTARRPGERPGRGTRDPAQAATLTKASITVYQKPGAPQFDPALIPLIEKWAAFL